MRPSHVPRLPHHITVSTHRGTCQAGTGARGATGQTDLLGSGVYDFYTTQLYAQGLPRLVERRLSHVLADPAVGTRHSAARVRGAVAAQPLLTCRHRRPVRRGGAAPDRSEGRGLRLSEEQVHTSKQASSSKQVARWRAVPPPRTTNLLAC